MASDELRVVSAKCPQGPPAAEVRRLDSACRALAALIDAREQPESRHTPKYGEIATSLLALLMDEPTFEWDEAKNLANQRKHGVAFEDAQHAFRDPRRLVARDRKHSQAEQRYYCFGLDQGGRGILTVRFTYREGRIRIIGAGYWRQGKALYEQTHSLH